MKKLATLLFLLPTAALAQMVEHKPPAPIPTPSGRDLNNIGVDNSGKPTCTYLISSTSTRPRERTSAVLALDLSAGGTPTKAEISDSTGSSHLDQASLMCAKSWHYKLTAQSGQPTSVKLEIRWHVAGPPPGPDDDEPFVGSPVLEGSAIADVSL